MQLTDDTRVCVVARVPLNPPQRAHAAGRGEWLVDLPRRPRHCRSDARGARGGYAGAVLRKAAARRHQRHQPPHGAWLGRVLIPRSHPTALAGSAQRAR